MKYVCQLSYVARFAQWWHDHIVFQQQERKVWPIPFQFCLKTLGPLWAIPFKSWLLPAAGTHVLWGPGKAGWLPGASSRMVWTVLPACVTAQRLVTDHTSSVVLHSASSIRPVVFSVKRIAGRTFSAAMGFDQKIDLIARRLMAMKAPKESWQETKTCMCSK